MMRDLFSLDSSHVAGRVAGVDEVGRGPLAGDVVTAAVILDPDKPIQGLNDSKKLTAARRESLSAQIKEDALCWSIARASVEEIDALNILQASLLAMHRAVQLLAPQPTYVLVDGNHLPKWPYASEPVIKGDARVPAIAAASILAKVQRDAELAALDELYPGYGFARHKGYPTAAHLQALDKLGVTAVHRKSYAPVKKLLADSRPE